MGEAAKALDNHHMLFGIIEIIRRRLADLIRARHIQLALEQMHTEPLKGDILRMHERHILEHPLEIVIVMGV